MVRIILVWHSVAERGRPAEGASASPQNNASVINCRATLAMTFLSTK